MCVCVCSLFLCGMNLRRRPSETHHTKGVLYRETCCVVLFSKSHRHTRGTLGVLPDGPTALLAHAPVRTVPCTQRVNRPVFDWSVDGSTRTLRPDPKSLCLDPPGREKLPPSVICVDTIGWCLVAGLHFAIKGLPSSHRCRCFLLCRLCFNERKTAFDHNIFSFLRYLQLNTHVSPQEYQVA